MKNDIILFTVVFYFFAIAGFIICKFYQKRIEKSFDSSEHVSFESLSSIVNSLSPAVRCTLAYGSNWNYDVSKNTVSIPKKNCYSLYDRFILLHETGHYLDSKTTCRVAYKLTFVLRVINILAYFPVIVFSLLQLKNTPQDCTSSSLLLICSIFLLMLLSEMTHPSLARVELSVALLILLGGRLLICV